MDTEDPSVHWNPVEKRILSTRSALVRWWNDLPAGSSDALLYGVSALFALFMTVASDQSAQTRWGWISAGPFALAAFVAFFFGRLRRRDQIAWRAILAGVVGFCVVVIPLGVEIALPNPVGQPEVWVIERSAFYISHFESPYRSYVFEGHLVNEVHGIPSYESFFPYFPLMSVFGLPSALDHRVSGPTDARVIMSLCTLLLMAGALVLLRSPSERKLRIAQLLVVLPTGSLFLATGGDDMPILALCLLALVTLQRRQVWTSGLLLGAAAAMKLTAWPFAVATLLVARDKHGRRSWGRLVTEIGAIVAVVVLPFAIHSPHAFTANVLEFPAGLAGIHSPAASPLPGHLLTTWFPVLSHVIMPLVFVFGGAYLARRFQRHWPETISEVMRILAAVMAVLICAATATRVGYVIYPLNFWLWAWAFDSAQPDVLDERVVLVEA